MRSRPGASAQAAYQRRQQEFQAWLHGWWWRLGAVVGAAAGVDLLVGLTVGAWLGSLMALVAALVAGWRLRFHPPPAPWRGVGRPAQRRTASALQPLEQRGDLVLHDVTLPGWPAGLEHLVIGSTGVGHPGLAPQPAVTEAHGDIAMAGTRRHGRSAAEAALAGGSLR